MPMENKTVARRLYEEVWNERKLAVVDKLLSPSHALQEPNASGSQIGPQAYKATVTRFLTGLPDLKFTIQDLISEGDKLVVSWVLSGTHQGEFYGIAPTNKKVSVEGITIHQIAKGKILESFASWDRLGMMRQLETVPAKKQSAVGGSNVS
jgi:steroid delta-isomerase-like uncharacterized protein